MIVHDTRGLSKGFGYITYSTTEEATHAITQQNGGIYEGREVVVNYANTTYNATRNETNPTRTLYIGNIPYELTDVDLQEIFEDLKGITDVRIPVDRRTGLPRGFGHVDFADLESATAAKEMLNRKAPYGRKLFVNYAKRKIMTPEDYSRYKDKKTEKRDSEVERQTAGEGQSPTASEVREPENRD
ncbi:unnamed protein product [Penicillium olsonii]|nr:unnamed protein product [Penicillium olsonii]CAG7930597.1 unnamed protein product [Penicillium olsonii]